MVIKGERTVRGLLIIGIGLMFILVLATPLVLHNEEIGIPSNPRLLVDYVAEEDEYIFLFTAATGDHLYTNITLVVDGTEEVINRSYSVERCVPAGRVNVTITMFDETGEMEYRLNMTIERKPIEGKMHYTIYVHLARSSREFDMLEDDFPFRFIIKEVKQ